MTVTPTTPPWLVQARRYLGLKEGPGAADNPTVVAFYADCGHPEVKHDATAWCAAFVGSMLHKAGIKGTGTLWALDYSHYGQKLLLPVLGAIATKKRTGGGHVAFVVAASPSTVWLLGGNQGDAVCIEAVPRSSIFSYALPPGYDAKTLPALPIKATGGAGVSEA